MKKTRIPKTLKFIRCLFRYLYSSVPETNIVHNLNRLWIFVKTGYQRIWVNFRLLIMVTLLFKLSNYQEYLIKWVL